MRPIHLVFIVAAAFAVVAHADDPVLQQPVPHRWIVDSCNHWNSAVAAMIIADGDPYVMAIPVDSLQTPWLIIRRVPGGITGPDDAPFVLETYDNMADATARYSAIDPSHIPTLITTTDQKWLIVYAREVPVRRRVTRQ